MIWIHIGNNTKDGNLNKQSQHHFYERLYVCFLTIDQFCVNTMFAFYIICSIISNTIHLYSLHLFK